MSELCQLGLFVIDENFLDGLQKEYISMGGYGMVYRVSVNEDKVKKGGSSRPVNVRSHVYRFVVWHAWLKITIRS